MEAWYTACMPAKLTAARSKALKPVKYDVLERLAVNTATSLRNTHGPKALDTFVRLLRRRGASIVLAPDDQLLPDDQQRLRNLVWALLAYQRDAEHYGRRLSNGEIVPTLLIGIADAETISGLSRQRLQDLCETLRIPSMISPYGARKLILREAALQIAKDGNPDYRTRGTVRVPPCGSDGDDSDDDSE